MERSIKPQEIEKRVNTLSKEDWQELENIYREIKEHEGSFAEPVEKKRSDGTIELGPPKTAPVVRQVMKYFYSKNLIVDFDWGNWQEGKELFAREGKDKFNDISLEEALMLITAVARSDRFFDGAWADIFETGDAELLFKRLLEFKPKQ